ncbi:MAG: lysophospholipase [Acidimicrobiia bacterium]
MSATGTITARDGLTLLTRHWAADPARATVLLVHGLAEHSGRYEHVGTFLAEHGYDTHAFDLRGHGGSGGRRVDGRSVDDFLDDVELNLTRTRNLGRPLVLYGHSLGGLLCTAYAESGRPQPDLLVLSAPALDANLSGFLEGMLQVLGRVVPTMRVGSPVAAEQLSRDPEVGRRYFADPLVSTKGTARFGLVFLRAMKAAAAGIGAIRVPTLVIHGEDDPLVPVATSAPLGALPVCERIVFPGLRHETHNEPEWRDVLGRVTDWIDGHPGDQDAASPR